LTPLFLNSKHKKSAPVAVILKESTQIEAQFFKITTKIDTMKQHNYYTYIVTNSSKSTLYTGVTNDIERRLEEHRTDAFGNQLSFAGKYHCYNLIYFEYSANIKEAIGREKSIKNLTRKKKEELIEFFNPEWRFLNSEKEKSIGNLPIWTLEMEDKRPW
jgi:putative endonuclease